MMDFLKQLFGGATSSAPRSATPAEAKQRPPIPADVMAEFQSWFLAQRRPAVALYPDPTGTVGAHGSRLGGPAWLAEGETWPIDKNGVPMEFLAQLDLADRASLGIGPSEGVVQFFIGRDDLFGADFDNLLQGQYRVRYYSYDAVGALHPPPTNVEIIAKGGDEYSVFESNEVRLNGLPLIAEPFDDRLDVGLMEVSARFDELHEKYDEAALWQFVESDELLRRQNHHTGGYPAYTQNDIREQAEWAEYDHVLLRITSENGIMWGDAGEAVFMIRPADLERGDFSKVLYSWDCG